MASRLWPSKMFPSSSTSCGAGQVLEQGTKTQIEPTRKIAQYDTIIVKPRTYEADGSELVAAALEVSPATSRPSQNL